MKQSHFIVLVACYVYCCIYSDGLHQEYMRLADILKDEGYQEKAIRHYIKALELQPTNVQALFNCANCLYAQNDLEKSILYYNRIIEIRADCPSVYFNLGICYMRLQDYRNAIKAFENTVHYNDQHAGAHQQLSQLYFKHNNFKKVIVHGHKALVHNTKDTEMLLRLGQSYKELDDYDNALACLRKALEISPCNIQLLLELANILNMSEDISQALKYYNEILKINPTIQEVLYNIGFTLKKQGNFEQAIAIYTKILKDHPSYAHPHFSLALCYLTLGHFEQGWQEYEWRWAAYNEKKRTYSAPEWQGQDVQGKAILIYAEQGLGDTFQFIRYAQELKQSGAYVIVDTQTPLKTILRLVPYIDKVIDSHDPLPSFDYHIPLMSLPLIFKTTVENIPVHIPYLYADQQLVEHWRTKLCADKKFKIGICWQGNAHYSTQFLRKAVAAKSLHLKEFEPLAHLANVSLYSIQKINGMEQLNQLAVPFPIHIFDNDFDAQHGRFMDTAAVIKNMDLIITIDTSIGHFAAALGAPTWILLPEPADWRWMLERSDTPWYPNVRLFRQPGKGNWHGTLQNVLIALQEIINQKKEVSTRDLKK